MNPQFETAYPQLKDNLSEIEIEDIFTPTAKELLFASSVSGKVPAAKVGFLLHLKLFQRLGRFLKLNDVPVAIHQHITKTANIRRSVNKKQLSDYERSGTQQRHFKIIRDLLKVQVVDEKAREWLEKVASEAATTKNAESDIVNIILKNLIKERFELPGFTTIQRIARSARDKVNNEYYQKIISPLTSEGKKLIDNLFVVPKDSSQSTWQALKREPAKPTNKEVRQYLQHVQRLIDLVEQLPPVVLPVAKLRYFRQVARSQDAAQMAKLTAARRYALAIIYIRSQFSKTLDDTGNLFSRLFRNIENHGQEGLKQYQLLHVKRTDELIVQLKSILTTYQTHKELPTQQEALEEVLPSDIEATIAECEEHLAYAGNNFLPFMIKPYNSVRSLLLNCLDILSPLSTTSDKLTERLLSSLKTLRKCRLEIIDPNILGLNSEKDFTWLSEKWRRLVIIKTEEKQFYVHRKYYELAALQRIKNELNSLELYVQYSDEYNDYREQLVDDETFNRELPLYGEIAGIATDAKDFCQKLKDLLTSTAQSVDSAFPENTSAEIINGKLVLRKPEKSPLSTVLKELDKKITESLPENSIVDVLTDTEKWLQLHKLFGPLSESQGRMDDPEMRFITTLFCYGCNLGPSQTAKSVKGITRKQVAWLNLKNATEDRIDKAIFKVTNAYNKFKLPCYWGTGKHASVDGTKWNLYEQNLLSEYHIRYGGYGGIGYYLVSDKYIALFSHFITCGAYEGNYLIDLLVDNESDIQPEIIHGDTHAQNYPVFALTYLLGIQLMPRITARNQFNLKQSCS